MRDLTQMLTHHNPYILLYRTAHERLQQMSHDTSANGSKLLLDAKLTLIVEAEANCQRHNLPVADKVAMIMLEEKTGEPIRRDI